MFLAAWSTYAFETAICYTSEFRNPARDTSKAIFYSGVLCIGLFILVPFTFQGALGVTGMLAPRSTMDQAWQQLWREWLAADALPRRCWSS